MGELVLAPAEGNHGGPVPTPAEGEGDALIICILAEEHCVRRASHLRRPSSRICDLHELTQSSDVRARRTKPKNKTSG
jgi:hypothetical protein